MIPSSSSKTSSTSNSINSNSKSSKSIVMSSFFTVKVHTRSNIKTTEPEVPKFPSHLLKADLTFATVLLLLSVAVSKRSAIPCGA